ncbi:hypothetical protein HMJ29_16695 [Hymenobacter taeanensis]|uniref:Uncharacterized protein n=1 Tax=Hymenobacter taeanensis TaxID=2735321 RepID=A0A6M6BKW0_9BACT|nr:MULTISPECIES: DUF6882 domain-containing protein [Hymenobacter]QJX48464.1 hypothetical protein HMJ29_16695 [Hymenobacter taeanensis]UOQ82041.1 hypothetical protein MUN83_04435 [Hymenobacter sp. 5414T-23]
MNQLIYSDFAQSCLQDLIDLQDEFKSEYDIEWYENWFYNQSTGLLTFSTGEEEINFKYLSVGTFSRQTNTWKWSWDNENTLPTIKEEIITVKDFGYQSEFSKLTDGYFESSEEEAWEFTAITAKLTNSIGVYRPISEHLLVFMVLLEFVDKETAQNIKDKYIKCGTHEYGRRAFICNHLNTRAKAGFEESFETYENMELEEDDDFQAWCDKCEQVRQKEGGWNDNSMAFADIRLVCESCYFEIKELNLGYK